ncbi:MAG: 16S rRNA (cytosine(1402)-N(4))-methyltransferase RsmH [Deltaproteobacteria bacterium]|nr:MAG: 16S rRNA (cytosine(1402)-N(4))-methyltransferase RsmH [Deltaproteobacteria bacterium]
MSKTVWHEPVLAAEVVELLRPRAGGRYVDATVGDGGHAEKILEASAPGGRLLACDRDPEALERAASRLAGFGDRVELAQATFDDLPHLLAERGWRDGADGILLDLGVSSRQLDEARRGFSFSADGPLDMRMNPAEGASAADLLRELSERELAELLRRYGEERAARRIAREICRARRQAPITRTRELREAVVRAGVRGRPGHDPATRTFQALRIAVNDELGQLERFLARGWSLLRPGGRLAILSYHSLEDRLVKRAFAEWAADCVCPPEQPVCTCSKRAEVRLVTRRKRKPSPAEVERNPRARSAGLRVVERLGAQESAA